MSGATDDPTNGTFVTRLEAIETTPLVRTANAPKAPLRRTTANGFFLRALERTASAPQAFRPGLLVRMVRRLMKRPLEVRGIERARATREADLRPALRRLERFSRAMMLDTEPARCFRGFVRSRAPVTGIGFSLRMVSSRPRRDCPDRDALPSPAGNVETNSECARYESG